MSTEATRDPGPFKTPLNELVYDPLVAVMKGIRERYGTLEDGDEKEAAMSTPKQVISDLTISAIQAEALRAWLKFKDRNSTILSSISDDRRLAIVAEELGEVAKELNEIALGNPVDEDALEIELIQCAAMLASWVEAKGQGL